MASQQGSTHYDPLTNPIIHEFLTWIREHSCPGVIFKPESTERSQFVPDKVIEQYFNSKRDNDRARVRRLVEAATKNSSEPANARTIAQHCPRVFTILVRIGQSHFIPLFVQNARLHDRRLPFRADEARLFPKLEGGSTFFGNFYAQQWQFCVEKMREGLEPVQFDDPMILPIVHMDKLDKGAGASALVQKITVHADYDDLEVHGTDEVPASQQLASREPHVYVVKSYHRLDAETYFYAEVNAFRKLNETGRPVPNLIGFYGAFKQNGSYNIILQYANIGTLEDYFQKVKPPKLGKDILTLWRNLFNITWALIDIHDLPQSSDEGRPRIFQGWHQDIKPANILVTGDLSKDPYDVQFMLADLGLSHFTAVIENQAGPTGEEKGGARAYSSPELNLARSTIRNFENQVKQKNDTWSLACVYSEVDAWVVEGMDGEFGVDKYREQRQKEADTNGDSVGGCFHNRSGAVLQTVKRWHRVLPTLSANQDHVTTLIWNELLQYIFKASERRLTAPQVQDYSESVIKKAQSMLRSPPRRGTAPPSVTSDIPPSDSPPRTPPEVPPEFQDRRFLTQGCASYPMTPPYRNQFKPSQTVETYPGIVTQSPDSLKGGSSPPAGFGNRESLTSVAARDLLEAGSPGSEGLQRSFSADLAEKMSSGESQTPPDCHVQDQSKHPDYTQFYTPKNITDTQQAMQPEWQVKLPRRPTMLEKVSGHRHHPSNASNPAAPYGMPAVAQLASEVGPKGKDKLTEEPQSPRTRTNQTPKVLTVNDLRTWADLTQASSSTLFGGREHPLRFEKELIGELKKRDHIFVIDDAESMRPHWGKMRSLFADLIYMVKKKSLDPNGSELRFIMSDEHKESKDTNGLVQMVIQRGHHLKGESNFAARLDDILHSYKQNLTKKWKTPRPISLYVLTNGIWQSGNRQLEMVARAIQRMVEFLEQIGAKDKMVGIQFIRFGNDEVGMERLRWLDADLKGDWGLARDICDTTSAEGNVWKMMLGSINDYWDDDPDD